MALGETAKLLAEFQAKDGLTAVTKTMSSSLDKFDTRLDKSTTRAYKAGTQIGTGIKRSAAIISGAAIVAGAAVGGLFIKSINDANDLNETVSKSAVVFGKANAKVLALGNESSTALGLSKNAAIGAAATYGNLFVSMGLAQGKSADMSVALVNLAADLASFNNIDPADALDKLRAGLTGESEPLKTLGVNINETLIKQKAVELGLVKLSKGQKTYTATLPAAVKAQAAYALIFEQTKTAQGDARRTGDQFAGQTRKLAAVWTDAKAAFAGAALPGLAKVLGRIVTLIKDNTPLIATFGDKIAGLFTDQNIATGTKLLGDAFDAAKAAAPVVADAGNKILEVMKTSVGLFRSLPPELQALAVTGLAVNKLTGGLVTNIAGGLISAVISSFKGLMNVNAAVVNVNGGVVNGGGGLDPTDLLKVGGGAGAAGIGIGTLPAIAAIATSVGASVIATNQLRERDIVPLQERGLTKAEILARQYYTADQATQQQILKHVGAAPSRADFESGNLKLTITPTSQNNPANAAQDDSERALMGKRSAFSSNPTRAELRVKIRDLKELKPTKDTAKAIASLQGRLDHRIAEGNRKAAEAKTLLGDVKRVTAAIAPAITRLKLQPPDVNINVPVTNTVTIDGRTFTATLTRYQSVTGNFGGTAARLSGTSGA